MLRRVRAVAAALKFRGHPDLLNTEIRTLQNYWLKITGDSVMHNPDQRLDGEVCDWE